VTAGRDVFYDRYPTFEISLVGQPSNAFLWPPHCSMGSKPSPSITSRPSPLSPTPNNYPETDSPSLRNPPAGSTRGIYFAHDSAVEDHLCSFQARASRTRPRIPSGLRNMSWRGLEGRCRMSGSCRVGLGRGLAQVDEDALWAGARCGVESRGKVYLRWGRGGVGIGEGVLDSSRRLRVVLCGSWGCAMRPRRAREGRGGVLYLQLRWRWRMLVLSGGFDGLEELVRQS